MDSYFKEIISLLFWVTYQKKNTFWHLEEKVIFPELGVLPWALVLPSNCLFLHLLQDLTQWHVGDIFCGCSVQNGNLYSTPISCPCFVFLLSTNHHVTYYIVYYFVCCLPHWNTGFMSTEILSAFVHAVFLVPRTGPNTERTSISIYWMNEWIPQSDQIIILTWNVTLKGPIWASTCIESISGRIHRDW